MSGIETVHLKNGLSLIWSLVKIQRADLRDISEESKKKKKRRDKEGFELSVLSKWERNYIINWDMN